MTPAATTTTVARPTSVRWRICGYLLIVITLTFIDRFNMNVAAKYIQIAKWLGIASSFWLVRFLIGVGEAPALPNTNKLIGRWMAVNERARGSSLFLVAVGIGGAFTPPVIAWIMTKWGWRLSFLACGLLGFGIAALWH